MAGLSLLKEYESTLKPKSKNPLLDEYLQSTQKEKENYLGSSEQPGQIPQEPIIEMPEINQAGMFQAPFTTAIPENTQQPIQETVPNQFGTIEQGEQTIGDPFKRGLYQTKIAHDEATYFLGDLVGSETMKQVAQESKKENLRKLSMVAQASQKYRNSPEDWKGYLEPARLYQTFGENAQIMAEGGAITTINPLLGTAYMAGIEGGGSLASIEEIEKQTGIKIPNYKKKAIASTVGVVNGMLERVGLDETLKIFKASGIKAKAVQALISIATEGFTEGLQETVSIGGEIAAVNNLFDLSDATDEFIIALKDPQNQERITQATYGGAVLALGGGVGGISAETGSIAYNKIYGDKTDPTQSDDAIPQEIQPTAGQVKQTEAEPTQTTPEPAKPLESLSERQTKAQERAEKIRKAASGAKVRNKKQAEVKTETEKLRQNRETVYDQIKKTSKSPEHADAVIKLAEANAKAWAKKHRKKQKMNILKA